MPRRANLLFAAAFLTCGGPSAQQTQLMDAVAADLARQQPAASVAFRFATERGADARLYRLPHMEETAWRFDTPGLVVRHVVGFAGDDDEIYLQSPANELLVLDLNSGQARVADTNVARAALGPDGRSLLARPDGSVAQLIGRRAASLIDSVSGTITGLWAATRTGVLIAVDRGADRVLISADGDQAPTGVAIPRGPLALAPWSDVAAIATDSGLVTVDLTDDASTRFLPLDGISAITFSASGHRLYVTTSRPELITVERFELVVLEERPLPEEIRALRADPLGRFVLARPGDADRVLLLGVDGDTSVRATPGSWEDDLPQVAPDGSLLVRRGGHVVVVSTATLEDVGTVEGGAEDRWLIAAWDPRRPALQTGQTQRAGSASGTERLYLQVSSTSNPDWAAALARDLRLAGMKSTVLPPLENDVMYRVVLGPYANRAEAEEIGRTLGMPYWIFTESETGGQ